MIRSLWIAKTGMDVQQTNIDIVSNNLANVSSNGFKRAKPVFEDLIYQNLRASGAQTTQQSQLPNGLQVGTGARTVATTRVFTQGNLQRTENNLDVAISGDGFFQVQMPDGTTSYTRDGSFRLDANGQVVTTSGYPVLTFPPIPQGTESVSIGADGTVSLRAAGASDFAQAGQIQLASFINTGGLESRGQNLFVETTASGTPTTGAPGQNGLGSVQQGYVETSNVNVTEELINMIQAQRAFEINSRSIQASDQMLQRLTQL